MCKDFKRCLIGLQKGVSWTSKGHLLQAKRALIASLFAVFTKVIYEKLGQNEAFLGLEYKVYFLYLNF